MRRKVMLWITPLLVTLGILDVLLHVTFTAIFAIVALGICLFLSIFSGD